MRILTVVILSHLLCVAYVYGQHIPPKVTLDHGGVVVGMKKTVYIDDSPNALDVFLGIPFAVPPLSDKRFAPPEKMTWGGEVNTNMLKPSCWQYIYGEDTFEMNHPAARMWVNNTIMSEDCLYLNIWKPESASAGSNLPVMVWIYGGGYVSGTSTLDVYNASILAAKHNIVVMSMQYRVGAFGFLRLKQSSEVAMGNMGLMDQRMALEWMKNNIASFGGNPNQVTVFGESSGAVSSSLLWLSPSANIYFQRLIIESGSALTRWAVDTPDDAEKRGKEFTDACNCPDPEKALSESLDCLKKKDAEDLVNALYTITVETKQRAPLLRSLLSGRMDELKAWTENYYMYFDVPLKAVIDGSIIPKHPLEILEDPTSSLPNPPEVLLGVNRNEGMYFLLYGLILNKEDYLISNGSIILPDSIRRAASRETLESGGQRADFNLINAAQILSKNQLTESLYKKPAAFYGLPDVNNETPMSPEELMQLLDKMTGELDFICPVLTFADKVAALPNSKVYLYEFQYRTKNSKLPEWLGVMHGYEIEYVFGMPYSSTFQNNFYSFEHDEKELSKRIMTWWTNFAIHGNPNGLNGESTWPQYNPQESGEYLKIKMATETATDFHKEGCQFWAQQMQ